jgi:hypothetical protein
MLELIVELLGELLLQFVFEAVSQALAHLFGRRPTWPVVGPWLAIAGYALLGALCGALSVWLFPIFALPSAGVRVLNLVVTPVLVAAAVAWVGGWWRRRDDRTVRLDRFTYAYVFAFAMAAARFALGSAG